MLINNYDFTMEKLAVPFLKDRYFDRGIIKTAVAVMKMNDKKSVLANYDKIIDSNLDKILNQIDVETIIVGSTIDPLVSRTESRYIKSQIDKSTYIEFRKSGHLTPVSRVEKLFFIINDFFK